MITDEIIEAMEMMYEQCKNKNFVQAQGIKKMIEMLKEFDFSQWERFNEKEKINWILTYL